MTEKRTAKSGRTYWVNLSKRTRGDGARTIPFCADKNSEAYMRYYNKKLELRNQYPMWTRMKQPEWKEYMNRIMTMMISDVDFLKYEREYNSLVEDALDKKWKKIRLKESEYDGRNDEYDYT